jgi:histidine ammonia-lyase
MATNAAHHAAQVVENVEHVVAIELLAAAQGIDFRQEQLGPSASLGKGTAAAYELIREHVGFLEHDTPLAPMIEKVTELLKSGALVRAVEAVI